MGTTAGAPWLLRGAVAALVAGWLASGSCSVSYSSCTHGPYDCSAPKHEHGCPCLDGSSSAPAPPRAIAVAVEVDGAGRTRVRRWLLTARGPVALDRPDPDGGPAGARVPFTAP